MWLLCLSSEEETGFIYSCLEWKYTREKPAMDMINLYMLNSTMYDISVHKTLKYWKNVFFRA